jgi:hypothetical protein
MANTVIKPEVPQNAGYVNIFSTASLRHCYSARNPLNSDLLHRFCREGLQIIVGMSKKQLKSNLYVTHTFKKFFIVAIAG